MESRKSVSSRSFTELMQQKKSIFHRKHKTTKGHKKNRPKGSQQSLGSSNDITSNSETQSSVSGKRSMLDMKALFDQLKTQLNVKTKFLHSLASSPTESPSTGIGSSVDRSPKASSKKKLKKNKMETSSKESLNKNKDLATEPPSPEVSKVGNFVEYESRNELQNQDSKKGGKASPGNTPNSNSARPEPEHGVSSTMPRVLTANPKKWAEKSSSGSYFFGLNSSVSFTWIRQKVFGIFNSKNNVATTVTLVGRKRKKLRSTASMTDNVKNDSWFQEHKPRNLERELFIGTKYEDSVFGSSTSLGVHTPGYVHENRDMGEYSSGGTNYPIRKIPKRSDDFYDEHLSLEKLKKSNKINYRDREFNKESKNDYENPQMTLSKSVLSENNNSFHILQKGYTETSLTFNSEIHKNINKNSVNCYKETPLKSHEKDTFLDMPDTKQFIFGKYGIQSTPDYLLEQTKMQKAFEDNFKSNDFVESTRTWIQDLCAKRKFNNTKPPKERENYTINHYRSQSPIQYNDNNTGVSSPQTSINQNRSPNYQNLKKKEAKVVNKKTPKKRTKRLCSINVCPLQEEFQERCNPPKSLTLSKATSKTSSYGSFDIKDFLKSPTKPSTVFDGPTEMSKKDLLQTSELSKARFAEETSVYELKNDEEEEEDECAKVAGGDCAKIKNFKCPKLGITPSNVVLKGRDFYDAGQVPMVDYSYLQRNKKRKKQKTKKSKTVYTEPMSEEMKALCGKKLPFFGKQYKVQSILSDSIQPEYNLLQNLSHLSSPGYQRCTIHNLDQGETRRYFASETVSLATENNSEQTTKKSISEDNSMAIASNSDNTVAAIMKSDVDDSDNEHMDAFRKWFNRENKKRKHLNFLATRKGARSINYDRYMMKSEPISFYPYSGSSSENEASHKFVKTVIPFYINDQILTKRVIENIRAWNKKKTKKLESKAAKATKIFDDTLTELRESSSQSDNVQNNQTNQKKKHFDRKRSRSVFDKSQNYSNLDSSSKEKHFKKESQISELDNENVETDLETGSNIFDNLEFISSKNVESKNNNLFTNRFNDYRCDSKIDIFQKNEPEFFRNCFQQEKKSTYTPCSPPKAYVNCCKETKKRNMKNCAGSSSASKKCCYSASFRSCSKKSNLKNPCGCKQTQSVSPKKQRCCPQKSPRGLKTSTLFEKICSGDFRAAWMLRYPFNNNSEMESPKTSFFKKSEFMCQKTLDDNLTAFLEQTDKRKLLSCKTFLSLLGCALSENNQNQEKYFVNQGTSPSPPEAGARVNTDHRANSKPGSKRIILNEMFGSSGYSEDMSDCMEHLNNIEYEREKKSSKQTTREQMEYLNNIEYEREKKSSKQRRKKKAKNSQEVDNSNLDTSISTFDSDSAEQILSDDEKPVSSRIEFIDRYLRDSRGSSVDIAKLSKLLKDFQLGQTEELRTSKEERGSSVDILFHNQKEKISQNKNEKVNDNTEKRLIKFIAPLIKDNSNLQAIKLIVPPEALLDTNGRNSFPSTSFRSSSIPHTETIENIKQLTDLQSEAPLDIPELFRSSNSSAEDKEEIQEYYVESPPEDTYSTSVDSSRGNEKIERYKSSTKGTSVDNFKQKSNRNKSNYTESTFELLQDVKPRDYMDLEIGSHVFNNTMKDAETFLEESLLSELDDDTDTL